MPGLRQVRLGATIALGLTIATALAVAFSSPASAQAAEVQISELDCNSDPELVVIENTGDAPQDFTGWRLESDPPASEVFDLAALGSLAPGGSVTIQSGPFASGPFLQDNWGVEFVLRDDDATDYARIIDDGGEPVDEVACGSAATPAPTPEPSPVDGVPNGGGPPPPPVGSLTPTALVLLGGSMASLGAAMFSFPWLSRPPQVSTEAPLQLPAPVRREAPPAPPVASPRRRRPPLLGIALAGLLVALVVGLLWRTRS